MNEPKDISSWVTTGAWLFGVAVFCAPISILLHEMGHFGAYWAFGFDSPTIHYSYSGFAGESEFWSNLQAGNRDQAMNIADVSSVGIAALLGLVVSYSMVGFGIWIYIRFQLAVGLCFAACSAARFPLVAILFVLGKQHHDEAHVEQALGIPEFLLFLAGVVCTVASTLFAAYLLQRQQNGWHILPIVIGVAVGTICWMNGVGSFLMP